MERILFYIIGGLMVFTSLLMVTRRNPITSAIWLIASFFGFAAMYVVLQAHFIAVIQVLLYAGAIMVLFIFTIMLLNIGAEELKARTLQFTGVIGGAVTIYLIMLLVLGILKEHVGTLPAIAQDFGFANPVGELLFTRYLVPFELTSVLILATIVGSVVMGKRRL
ncbi:MAG: NADH-quinone oxidoreductase subunit J [Deltaproteobacteria bacterium]|nr:NADH-quinone oxidoreductase subunit J [Deltaproteobacteria bacterium]